MAAKLKEFSWQRDPVEHFRQVGMYGNVILLCVEREISSRTGPRMIMVLQVYGEREIGCYVEVIRKIPLWQVYINL